MGIGVGSDGRLIHGGFAPSINSESDAFEYVNNKRLRDEEIERWKREEEERRRKEKEKEEKEKRERLAKEEEVRRIAQEKAAAVAAQRTAKAADNVVRANLNEAVKAEKKKSESKDELSWYEKFFMGAAALSDRINEVAHNFEAGMNKGFEYEGNKIESDKLGNRYYKGKLLKPGEEEQIIKRDAERYKSHQDDTGYNGGYALGEILNVSASSAASIAPSIFRMGESLVNGIADVAKIATNPIVPLPLKARAVREKLSDIEEDVNLSGGEVGLQIQEGALNIGEGIAGFLDDQEGLQALEAGRKKVAAKGTALAGRYKEAGYRREEELKKDLQDQEFNPLNILEENRSDVLSGQESNPDRSTWDMVSGMAGYYARKPGRIFGTVADFMDKGLEGLQDESAYSNKVIQTYLKDNNIQARALLGAEIDEKDFDNSVRKYKTTSGEVVELHKDRISESALMEDPEAKPGYFNTETVKLNAKGEVELDAQGNPIYEHKFGVADRVAKGFDLGAIIDAQWLQTTGAGALGSVVGFAVGGKGLSGAVSKASSAALGVNNATRSAAALRSGIGRTMAEEAMTAAGKYTGTANRARNLVKTENLLNMSLQNYLLNDAEIRMNAEDTKTEIWNEFIDRAADMHSEQRTERRLKVLEELGLEQGSSEYASAMENLINQERLKFAELNPEIKANIDAKTEYAGELHMQRNRLAMLFSINEANMFFTRTKSLANSVKTNRLTRGLQSSNIGRLALGGKNLGKKVGSVALEGISEGLEESIGDYSNKAAVSLVKDNSLKTVADYYNEDFKSQEGLETFLTGALMGVGQTTAVSGLGHVANINSEQAKAERAAFKRQKRALQGVIRGEGAKSFSDLMGIYESVTEMEKTAATTAQINQALEDGDTHLADKLTRQAFVEHSARMASKGLSGEVNKNLSTLLQNPDTDPETAQRITEAMELNNTIAEMYDAHQGLNNRDGLLSNRINRLIAEEEIKSIEKHVLEGDEKLYNEELEKVYDEVTGEFNALTEEERGDRTIESERERAKADFDSSGNLIAGNYNNTRAAIKARKELLAQLDKSYRKGLTEDYQRNYKKAEQQKLIEKVRKAKNEDELSSILASSEYAPKDFSKELSAAVKERRTSFEVKNKVKENRPFLSRFKRKRTAEGSNSEENLVPIDSWSEDFLKDQESIQAQKETADEAEARRLEELQKQEEQAALQQELALRKAEKIDGIEEPVKQDLPEGDSSPEENREVYNKTLEDPAFEVPVINPQPELAEDPASPITDTKAREEEKARKVKEDAERFVKEEVPVDIMAQLNDALNTANGIVSDKNAQNNPTGNPEADNFDNIVWNRTERENKAQEKLNAQIKALKTSWKNKTGKDLSFLELANMFIASQDVNRVKDFFPNLSEAWLENSENKEAAQKEVDAVYEELFGIERLLDDIFSTMDDLLDSKETAKDSQFDQTESTGAPISVRANSTPITEVEVPTDDNASPETEPGNIEVQPEKGEVYESDGYDPRFDAALDSRTSEIEPAFSVNTEEYRETVNEEGEIVRENLNPDKAVLNRSVSPTGEVNHTNNVDNFLNPDLLQPGSEVELTPWDPSVIPYSEIPFYEYENNGRRIEGEGAVTNYQMFLDKYKTEMEENPSDPRFVDTVPIMARVKGPDGKMHVLGSMIPSVQWIGPRNITLSKHDRADNLSAAERKRLLASKIEKARNNLRTLRRQVISEGKTEFKVSHRRDAIHKKVFLRDSEGNLIPHPDGGNISKHVPLAQSDPNGSLVGVIKSVDRAVNPGSIKFSISRDGALLDESKVHIENLQEIADAFHANNEAGNTPLGWAYRFQYKGERTVDGITKKIYTAEKVSGNANQELLVEARESRNHIRNAALVQYVQKHIKDKNDPNLEKLDPTIAKTYQDLGTERIKQYEALGKHLMAKHGFLFGGLKAKISGGYAFVTSDFLDKKLDLYPGAAKLQSKFDSDGELIEVTEHVHNYDLRGKGQTFLMVDLESGTASNFEDNITGRKGYDAFSENVLGVSTLGFEIQNNITGEKMTVFSQSPKITLKYAGPAEVQSRPRAVSLNSPANEAAQETPEAAPAPVAASAPTPAKRESSIDPANSDPSQGLQSVESNPQAKEASSTSTPTSRVEEVRSQEDTILDILYSDEVIMYDQDGNVCAKNF